jgi:hypothetical protein
LISQSAPADLSCLAPRRVSLIERRQPAVVLHRLGQLRLRITGDRRCRSQALLLPGVQLVEAVFCAQVLFSPATALQPLDIRVDGLLRELRAMTAER